ncbi:MAG: hypothetical protein DHS20C16_19620 [Phycisphaerae bacterium]|nr:MAG: hypothetical protein DHS20C16_19620 [Phycisphaerae bacterium]
MFLRKVLTVGLVFGLLAMVGCSKVSQENYDKISTGMTVEEVEGILGSGETEGGGGVAIGDVELSGKVMHWGSDAKGIKVTFANGKVVTKSHQGL